MDDESLTFLKRYAATVRSYRERLDDVERARQLVPNDELRRIAEEYAETIRTHERRYRDLMDAVDRLPEREAEVVRLWYVEGLPPRRIASIMHYDVRHIYRLHGAALDKLGITKKA